MTLRPIGRSALATALILLTGTAWSDNDHGDASRSYSVHPLVSDGALPADHMDASLRNAWGIVFNPNGAVWVADNKTNTSTLYDGTGTKVSLGTFPEVHLPPGSNGDAAPTGIVFNSSADFVNFGSSRMWNSISSVNGNACVFSARRNNRWQSATCGNST